MEPGILDGFDLKLLRALQRDGRQSHVALAEAVHLSPSQCARRLAALEAAGIITGYGARLDAKALGLGVVALVAVRLDRQQATQDAAFRRALAKLDAVTECLMVTGDSDYLLRIVAPDLEAFSALLQHAILALPGVANVRSSLVLETVKRSEGLPLPDTEPSRRLPRPRRA